jgi:HK97 family phage portal protein
MTVARNLRSQSTGGSNWYGSYGDPSVIPPNSAIGRSAAGVTVNERSVISLMAVFSCLRILGDVVADLQPHVFRKTGIGVADIEVPAPEIITDPYADITAYDGAFRQVTSLGLGGNIYRLIVDRDADGNPTLTEILNPALIKVTMVQGVKTYSVGAVGAPLNADDIIHVPWATLPGGLVGLNPIEIGASTFGINIAAEDYAARFFSQGIHPGGILSVDKPLTPADAQRLQQELQVNHGGLAQSQIPMVIDANTKWESIAVNPETAQLLETRQFSKADISGFYGVPLYFLGDVSDRGGTEVKGVEEMLIAFVLTGLKGYSKRLDLVDTQLLPPGYYVKRDLNDIYKTNSQMLSMLLMTLRNAGIATANELRAIVNLPRSEEEGSDSLFAPLNSATSDWMSPEGGAIGAAASGATPSASPATSDTMGDDNAT